MYTFMIIRFGFYILFNNIIFTITYTQTFTRLIKQKKLHLIILLIKLHIYENYKKYKSAMSN